MNLDFTNLMFKEMACRTSSVDYENGLTPEGAFLIVLRDLDYETIDHLCKKVGNQLAMDPIEIYQMIRVDRFDIETEKLILETAYDIIHAGGHLGSKKSGEYIASGWIEHSLYEGELASVLAEEIGLDGDTAKKLGILHDIGRKFDFSFRHTIRGYEYLAAMGFEKDAICCLTHSFLSVPIDGSFKGNRCANCDPALDGFMIDEEGNGVIPDEDKKDDMTRFLEQYSYNPYDMIINIADLMAKTERIVSPYERVTDIYRRRKVVDSRNSDFFKVSFINAMRRLMYQITKDDYYQETYSLQNLSPQEIEILFKKASDDFSNIYDSIIENKKYI